ncbi:HNH endonuclease [Bifidobacterium sp.]|jgi:5-methylcytosine-specific restriction endonuclease McrA|uniref:HNH endonuclease n=1 Tax=Bifidobacterium sp. TaxID=41200 RepID=UPI0025C079CD|nr:HNH endonuclease [Bifidobacterium sp.]MCI1635195.1 HNH endonuclease [Bifidobacterium sp.]
MEKHNGKDSKTKICSEGGCCRHVRARGMCNMHYKRLLRAEGKLRDPWDERRRKNYEKRRARKNSNGPVEDFTNLDIYERDKWHCGICGLKVDEDLAYPDPMSASLDHIVPLSKGGMHTRKNVQLAHLRCNVSKGDKILNPQRSLLDIAV